jgi:NADH-quinone oxidoreductase subunit C
VTTPTSGASPEPTANGPGATGGPPAPAAAGSSPAAAPEDSDGVGTAGEAPTSDGAGSPTAVNDGLPALAADLRDARPIASRQGLFGARGSGDTSGYGGLVRTITLPGASPRPWGSWFDALADRLAAVLPEYGSSFGAAVESVVVAFGELTLHIRRDALPAVARAMRDDAELRFELCSSVSGVHYPGDPGRELHVAVHLTSLTHNRRIRLEASVPDADPHLPSLVPVYPTADWHERETWDFFGIIFDGHPALTRIEMPDDWPGHPQRKDYPLGGIPVEYKGATIPPPSERRNYS